MPLIGPYPQPSPPPALLPYDARAPLAAERVLQEIRERLPGVSAEHIGSTSVPGCDGKGYVDLLLVYHDEDELQRIKDALEGLGCQRQRGRDPWPEDRPMRTGTITHDGATFLLHVHVVSAASPEPDALRRFRDRLRAEPALVAAYVAQKRAILEAGVLDGVDYSEAKTEFITHAARAGDA
jgi:GrpB-like predicted nucleotidyltransferase (UPF0157 family)